MARTGLSQSFYAVYSYDESQGSVAYSDGGVLGKAVECTIEAEEGEENIFYANNGPAESDSTFGGGTLTILNDRLEITPLSKILGLTPGTSSTPAGTTLGIPAEPNIPYIGYGTVARHKVDNSTKYRAIILPKVKFNVPAFEMQTQGETVEFGGHNLTAQIFRSDVDPYLWINLGDFASEADAVSYIKGFLSISS